MARTRRVDCNDPGLRRVRRGRGFGYLTHEGETVTDPEVIERIRSLAIPPAWTDVWICDDPRGHIQATGFDDAGRKQYRYHDDWRVHRDRLKFEEMVGFARRLPKLRERIRAGLALSGLGPERVMACAVALLDLGLFRVGSERYEEDHGTYGLTTLKIRHVSFEDGAVAFSYKGKLGQPARHLIADQDVARAVRSLVRRRGGGRASNLLGFRRGREWHQIGPDEVNAWIQDTIGDDYSAKDFRTWNATVMAAAVLAEHGGETGSAAARRRIVKLAVEEVARLLGNTPAVARGSYIDPRVFDRFSAGETIRPSLARLARGAGAGFVDRAAIERAVIRLL